MSSRIRNWGIDREVASGEASVTRVGITHVGADGVDANGVDANGVGANGVGANGVSAKGTESDDGGGARFGMTHVGADGVDADGVDADGVDAAGVDADGVNAGGVDADGVSADGVDADGAGPNDSVATTRPIHWQAVHAELLRLARSRAGLDWQEGHWLVRALESGVYIHFGYGSFAEYIERLFGYTPRWTAEKLRVAEALEELPETAQALRDGVVSWSAVRELTRVATPETEAEWLHVVRGRTVREIEGLVSGQRLGNRPCDPPDPMKRRHVLRFEVTAETYALFREAQGKVRRDAGTPTDDDSTLLLIAREILAGPRDAGRSSYQVVLTVCGDCKRGRQQARGQFVEVSDEVTAMAACDAQCVDVEGTTHVGASQEVKNASRPNSSAGRPEALNPGRASQSIPPATRRLVMRRDHGRCVVPGCRHASYLDVHHIELRSEGGGRDPDKLIVLCGAHHRAQHRGLLCIEGSVSSGLRIRHSDGTEYGMGASPTWVELAEKAFGALRALGFRETEVRRALERVSADPGTAGTLEELVRQALGVLTN